MQSSLRMADDKDRGGPAKEDTDGSPRDSKVTFDVGDGSPDME